MSFRRGMARSLNELEGQVARWLELNAEEQALEATRQEHLAQVRDDASKLEQVRRKKATIRTNVVRFYEENGNKYFSPGTTTIKLPSGAVWSRATKELKLIKSQRRVIALIIKHGLWRQLLRIELNLSALKTNPRRAAKVGVEVVDTRVVIITPPK